jgi:hypothetical protein
MYRSRLLAVLLVLSALMFSCSGEDGATGPAGPPGADGTDGTDGNANVIVFHFGSRTSTGTIYYPFDITQAVMEQSLVLGYYNPEAIGDTTTYYPVPGLGPWANYMTRCYTYRSSDTQYTYQLSLMTPNGGSNYTTSTVISRFKLIVCPASVINSRGLLDLSDYNAVREYLKLPE